MYIEVGIPYPHFVSIKTNKHYRYRYADPADRIRALKQLESDDTPAPEPEPEAVQIVQPQSRPIDVRSQVRATLDEIKNEQMRKK